MVEDGDKWWKKCQTVEMVTNNGYKWLQMVTNGTTTIEMLTKTVANG